MGLSITWPLAAGAQEAHPEPPSPVLALSGPIRAALVQEMQEVDANVQRITAALPRADWASLAEAAQAIQGSFVLQQQLTAQQRAELHRALPQAFLALDASFQDTAERLGAAARRREADLTAFYTYKLLDACTSCHARYAPHRSHAFGAEAPKGH